MKEHVYNSIPHQSLTHANQLTLKLWNDYINQLRTQTNTLTTNEETLYRWLFSEYDLSSFVFGEKSFVEYVIDNIVSHASTLKSHSETLNTHKTRLDNLDNEIKRIKEGPTEVHTSKNYSSSGNIATKFSSIDNTLLGHMSCINENKNSINNLNTEIYNPTEGLKKRMNDAEDAIKTRSAIYVITYE